MIRRKRNGRAFLKVAALVGILGLLSLEACSGGGSKGGAGIGGSGYKAEGTVTEFGSVFVNGVEFDTSSASFDIEGVSGSQSSLSIGMRVTVEGTLDATGTAGVAQRVVYAADLEGPIPAGSTITEDADQETKRFTILGVNVLVDSSETTFGGGATYQSLTSGDNLEISGFFDHTGLLTATAVLKKAGFSPNSTLVEAKGKVTGVSGSTLSLLVGGTTLSVDTSSANLSQVPGALAVGQVVKVVGTIASETATLVTATVVKLIEPTSDGVQLELEGIITRFASAGDFDVNGTRVNAASATLSPGNLVLALGGRVEVEGTLTSGVLVATAVKARGGKLRLRATASNANAAAGTFEITIAGQTVRVRATSTTRFKDLTTPLSGFGLATLTNLNGRFVKVRGFDDGTGAGLVATRVDIAVQGSDEVWAPITAQVIGTSVTVLGVAFPVDGTTKFLDTSNTQLADQTAFANQVTLGTTLIRVRDRQPGTGGANAFGVADDVEIQ